MVNEGKTDGILIGYGVVAGFNVGTEKPPHDKDIEKENRSQDSVE